MPLSWRALLLLSFSSIAGTASAQDMVYTPINPSFGGNPFNSSHLIGIANAQNNFKDPKSTTSNSQADRKSAVWGKSVSVSVDLGGRRVIKKKKNKKKKTNT